MIQIKIITIRISIKVVTFGPLASCCIYYYRVSHPMRQIQLRITCQLYTQMSWHSIEPFGMRLVRMQKICSENYWWLILKEDCQLKKHYWILGLTKFLRSTLIQNWWAKLWKTCNNIHTHQGCSKQPSKWWFKTWCPKTKRRD